MPVLHNAIPDVDHRLCDKGAGSGGLVLPGWWKSTDGLVVSRKTVDTGLDENEAELAVLVLPVALEVLPAVDGLEVGVNFEDVFGFRATTYLLDEHVKVLWNLWGEAY